MRHTVRFWREAQGASAVEFALVLPVVILFLLGIIDVGRFIWNTNEIEKAVQIGTRWAVATDYLPVGLEDYSYAVSGGVPQGEVVPQSKFTGFACTSAGCMCEGLDTDGDGVLDAEAKCGVTDSTVAVDAAAFGNLVGRMQSIYAGVGPNNVEVNYDWSGLGYSGDPNGSDVDPLVTVTVKDVGFRPIFLAGIFDFGLPDLSYTLTMEDGEGAFSN
ncbi:TadE/TadG family type IV pilus assembly protein [Croceicoccus marinus]|uniref:Pilus assembly protein n=1 Tax=Croceicoccus marinus TaxID=450378 RepID=A0A7G6VUC1_9SPHN|nr:TadE family protein [Croceicoccus marinus]QNE05336.1 pilus assembly protein [Croceicoccus marinus]